MLKITHGEYKIEVRFFHRFCRPYDIKSITGICVNEDRRCSFAMVTFIHVNGQLSSDTTNDQLTYHGMAVCHPVDNFCRATGRKRALSNALLGLADKELRKAIWKEYEARCGF